MSNACVLITGAARGIGLAIAKAVVHTGNRAILWDVDASALQERASELGSLSCFANADISDPDSIDEATRALPSGWAPTHLVNNAGVLGQKMALDAIDPGEIDRVLSINVKGLMLSTQAFLKTRRAHANAAIVNMSSIAGFNGGAPGHAVYGATKGAVLALTRAMARDLAPEIRVNAIAPGIIETDMQKGVFADDSAMRQLADTIPQKRIGTAADVAETACHLLFGASYVTGEIIRVAGGRI
ncbi:SDR family NAD(P)-dependent oxidoreductase [Rhizobium sp. L1K21]|uniref:SDR family NAD(P)-dependent oxidoreductase n=1 Tax=Rhizobium sp. L1K21 TaxID=2954933 RepID=UPI0020931F2E|nr:SDR family oxidoreductase [Rhizobium sp. L1K21]MCO6187887.1 SDR family oxidoreductase [Rhizobium sp. L1K21]